MGDETIKIPPSWVDGGLKMLRLETVTRIGNVYSDRHGNSVTDGPNRDVAHCNNNAQPTAAQMADAIKKFNSGTPFQSDLNVRVFKKGDGPFDKMCGLTK